jgi:hypothetical protein
MLLDSTVVQIQNSFNQLFNIFFEGERMSGPEDGDSQAQVSQLESEIEALRTGHRTMYSRKYGEFFAHAKEISQLFKESRSISHTERERLWGEFRTLCDNVKEEGDRERESRINNSRVKKSVIEGDIREAYYWAKGANNVHDLREADSRLAAITEKLKDGWGGFTGSTDLFESMAGNDGRLTKEDRDLLWEKWREAKAAVRERREWLSELHYDHMRGVASNCLNLAHSDPKAAKEQIKSANAEMKQNPMNTEQYSSIREMLDHAWEAASRTAREKHDEWRERMENHVERWSELYEKNEDVIRRLEQQIEECEAMESNAKSDDFAETVRGWIEEKMDKIRDIRRTNQELEERIESVKSKLSK